MTNHGTWYMLRINMNSSCDAAFHLNLLRLNLLRLVAPIRMFVSELGPIPLRNWNCLPIPIPIPELELELNWLFPV